MQKKVQKAFDRFQQLVEKLAAEAIEQKQIDTDLKPEEIRGDGDKEKASFCIDNNATSTIATMSDRIP